jgi:hypothetical protein
LCHFSEDDELVLDNDYSLHRIIICIWGKLIANPPSSVCIYLGHEIDTFLKAFEIKSVYVLMVFKTF